MSQSNPQQDPWGNQVYNPQPSQLPQQTQPFNYPQGQYPIQPPQGYYQPSQQPPLHQPPQQGLWNPSGVYGGVPEPKKGMPWWGTAIILVLALGIVGTIGALYRASAPATTQSGTQETAPTLPARIATPKAEVQSAPTAVSTSQRIGKVGETLSLNGYTLTVNAVQKADNFSGNSIDQADTGNIFIAVDLTIGSMKNKGVSANALYASLKDSQGYQYSTGIFGDKEPSLKGANDIPSGDKVRGWVTFQVPKTASGFVLEYAQLFESERIRVNLGL